MREIPAPGDPAARRPAGAGEKWFVLGVVGVGTFMSALDGSVVNIAIPLIQRHYGATIGDVSWVVTAYLLAISSLLLTFGRLGDMWGYKGVYSAGYAVFGVGSLLCGLAPTLGGLVLARAVQGVGASMLMAIAPALIATTFPAAERGRALGLQATLTYAGLTVGPSLGGWIAGRFGWHWVFLVNVPVSAAGGLLALTVLRAGSRGVRQRFDLPGAGLLAAGLTAMLLGLSRGETWGWQSLPVAALFAGGALFLALFVVQERRAADPMMPLWLLRRPAFAGGVTAAFLQYTVVFMLTFLLPFYLQGLRGLTPQQAGAVMTAQPAAMVAVAAMSGWLADRVGSRLPAVMGMAVLGTGLWLVSRAGAQTLPSDLMVRLGLVGLGSGLFTAPNNSVILGAAPRDRQGVASGLLAAARNVGMVTGVAASGSLFAFVRGRLQAAGAPAAEAFLGAFRTTVLVAVALATAGTLLSLIRPEAPGDR